MWWVMPIMSNVQCKSVKKNLLTRRVWCLKSMKWLYLSGEMLVNNSKQQTHAKREEVGQVSTTDWACITWSKVRIIFAHKELLTHKALEGWHSQIGAFQWMSSWTDPLWGGGTVWTVLDGSVQPTFLVLKASNL